MHFYTEGLMFLKIDRWTVLLHEVPDLVNRNLE